MRVLSGLLVTLHRYHKTSNRRPMFRRYGADSAPPDPIRLSVGQVADAKGPYRYHVPEGQILANSGRPQLNLPEPWLSKTRRRRRNANGPTDRWQPSPRLGLSTLSNGPSLPQKPDGADSLPDLPRDGTPRQQAPLSCRSPLSW